MDKRLNNKILPFKDDLCITWWEHEQARELAEKGWSEVIET